MKYYLHTLLGFFVFFGCDSSVEAPIHTIMPLKEGNMWVYEQSEYDSLHNPISRLYDTVKLGAAVMIDGEQWFPLYHIPKVARADSEYFANRANGVWKRTVTTIVGGSSISTRLFCKYPFAVNDTFNLSIGNSFPSGFIRKSFTMTLAVNEDVTTPLGTFASIHNRMYLQRIDSVTYDILTSTILLDQNISLGIGEIKSTYRASYLSGGPDSLQFETFDHEKILVGYSFK